MWVIWRKTLLLQKECEWGRQTMHKWLVGICMFGIHCIEMGLQPTKNWAAVFARIAETFGVVIFYLYPHHNIT